MAGWGGFLGKIADQFQGRIGRAKNERVKLDTELKQIMGRPATADSVMRASKINDRIKEIDIILRNKAAD